MLLLAAASTVAFTPFSATIASASVRARMPSCLVLDDAVAKLSEVQGLLLDYVVDSLNLFANPEVVEPEVRTFIAEQPKQDSTTLGLEGARALAAERVVSGKSKAEVTWCSSLDVRQGGESASTLTMCVASHSNGGHRLALCLAQIALRPCSRRWNNPTIGIPHYLCATGVSGGMLRLSISFLDRAEAGYETRQPDGSYPEPTSREMFALASTRKELEANYYTAEAVAWCEGLRSASLPVPAEVASLPLALGGPLALEALYPLTSEHLDLVTAAMVASVERWLGWMAEAERLDQRKTMLTFAHDAKVRATAAAVTRARLAARFGDRGIALAAADAGPMDIADRGAAQNAAASSNFDASEQDRSAVDMQRLADEGRSIY